MSKEEKEVESTIPEAKDIALGYSKIKDGKWAIIRIDFDLETGYTKTPTVIETLDSEADAVSRFKVTVSQQLMMRYRR